MIVLSGGGLQLAQVPLAMQVTLLLDVGQPQLDEVSPDRSASSAYAEIVLCATCGLCALA